MTPQLESIRLLLEPLSVEDAPEMVVVLADPELHTFTGDEPRELVALTDVYARLEAGCPSDDEIWHNWILRSEGSAIGFVQATVVGEEAELAWVVGVNWQRQGFAKEGAKAVADWLRSTGVTEFRADIHPQHEASQRVAQSLGLEVTSEMVDGEFAWRGR